MFLGFDPNNPPVIVSNVLVTAGNTLLSQQFQAPARGFAMEVRLTPLDAFTATQQIRSGCAVRASTAAAQVIPTAGIVAGDARAFPVDVDSIALPSYVAQATVAEALINVEGTNAPFHQYELTVATGSVYVTVVLGSIW